MRLSLRSQYIMEAAPLELLVLTCVSMVLTSEAAMIRRTHCLAYTINFLAIHIFIV